jgi:WD40 repeat protein
MSQQLITTGADVMIRWWLLPDGICRDQVLVDPPIRPETSLRFSDLQLCHGDELIVFHFIGQPDIHIWSAQGSHDRRGVLETGYVQAFATTPDGELIVTVGGADPKGLGWLRIWKQSTHEAVAAIRPKTLQIETVAISPDGKWIATGSTFSRIIRVWSVKRMLQE